MSVTLQHDPKTKQMLKDMLYNYLYTPVEIKLRKSLEAIVKRNTLLQKASHLSFTYKGEDYVVDDSRPPIKRIRLHPDLYKEMDEYLEEKNQIDNYELPYVLGFINQVLNSSNHFCDYLKVFPEVLHEPLNNLIDPCPSHSTGLTDEKAQTIIEKNQKTIQMIKERMVRNLLL